MNLYLLNISLTIYHGMVKRLLLIFMILKMMNLFIIIIIIILLMWDIRVRLRAPRLILHVLKLTAI